MPKPRSGDGDGLVPPPLDVSAKRDALVHAQARFAQSLAQTATGTFLQNAYDAIQNQRLRTTIVTVAVSIGISFAGAGMASVLAKGMGRAFGVADGVKTVANLSLKARAGIFAVRVATETIVGTAGQVALTGDEPWKALVENAIMTVGLEGTSGIDRERHRRSARVPQAARRTGRAAPGDRGKGTQTVEQAREHAARVVGREVLAISGETVMGMAAWRAVGADRRGPRRQARARARWRRTDGHDHPGCLGRDRSACARARRRSGGSRSMSWRGTAAARTRTRLVDHARQLEALSSSLINAPDAQKALDVLALPGAC